MTSGPTPSLRMLFDAAAALDPAARARYLRECCPDEAARAQLERLLAADASPGDPWADRPAAALAEAIGPVDREETPWAAGRPIGPYQLLETLGEGGSSTVFRAVRDLDGARQQVALKLLRSGVYSADARRLFRRERQTLAALSHPNIAHLIDGGVTDEGIPYLVMEYVDGVPITRHADAQRLDLRARLRLMIVVCRAVAAAHRALIVHRDLKPSNILVTAEGAVKLVDFGIAKLLDESPAPEHATRPGQSPLTPGYAAPEQFSGGAISTATDVYALGVLLYELMLGERPARPPRRPSARAADRAGPGWLSPHAFVGDLDNIVMKSLEEEPARRYASAADLADDIERHLEARPVLAHPPSRRYRMRKFVMRHRASVTAALALSITVLAALAVALWQGHEARQQAQRANTVRDFLIGVFDSARASLPRDQRPTPEALVAHAQRQLAELPDMAPETRLDLLTSMAEVWLSLSAFAQADTALSLAEVTAREIGRDDLVGEVAIARADGWQRAGDSVKAIRAIEPVLPALRQADSPALLRALNVLAAAQLAVGTTDESLSLQREALAVATRRHGADSPQALAAALNLGGALALSQRYPEAVAQLTPALAAWRRTQAPEDDRYVRGLSSLTVAADALGDLADAERHYRELLALKRRIYPPEHDAIAGALRDLASVLARGADPAEAEALLREALRMQQAIFGGHHRELAITHDTLGALLTGRQRYEEGEREYRAALEICAQMALRDEVCSRARNNLGQAYYRQERLAEAEQAMTQALAERRELLGEDHPTVAYSLATLANVASKAKDYGRAVALAEQAVAQLERTGYGRSRETVMVRGTLVQALRLVGRLDEALALSERVLSEWRELAPDARTWQVVMLVEKAQIERALLREDAVRGTLAAIGALAVPDGSLSPRTRALIAQLGQPPR
jgi:serine/threonine protein kinase